LDAAVKASSDGNSQSELDIRHWVEKLVERYVVKASDTTLDDFAKVKPSLEKFSAEAGLLHKTSSGGIGESSAGKVAYLSMFAVAVATTDNL
jgi:hypothetical protein